ncbi:terminase [Clostridiaceae bacterium UIB06]|uniref:Terminase n=1 Tax=Clostridium thailandense TaxID=2794346 RepID=A0A949TZD0_9CLOT|nr:terminase [Clostridium thailandense]MBV7275453.1 terminase [Clostridium thailandense]MCH5136686.1 terminase [Clostridiaceae bacterium UIB06]
MLTIKAFYDNKALQDITHMCKSIQISGDVSQVARKLDITMAYPITDSNQPRFQVGTGTLVTVFEDNKEIYRGFVQDREINSGNQEVVFTAYDYLIYLLKSKVTYNFSDINSEYAVEKICSDLGLKYNWIPQTGIKINRLIQNMSAYEAIMEIYTQVSKIDGQRYYPYADYDMLSVMGKGKLVDDIVLSSLTNINATSYKDTTSNMVNKIIVYDENNYWVGEVANAADVKYYGVFQDIYQKEEDKDWRTVANNMLHGRDIEINVTALGNYRCKTGWAVRVKIPYVDILADTVMYIDTDTHTWNVATGMHTMDLKLNLNNVMDLKED